MENRFKQLAAYLFLVLFIGYYGSITLFYHPHYVLGNTIVHSHPFKANSKGSPIHSHTTNGYITIKILSCIAVSLILFYFSFKTVPPVIYEIVVKSRKGPANLTSRCSYSLRAPPVSMLN